MHILVLEDNPDDFFLLQNLFRENTNGEFEIEHVSYLKDAKTRIAQGGIDLVFCDLNVPDSQGLQTYREIIKAAPNLPVVILTGENIEEQTAIEALKMGAQDYLTKNKVDRKSLLRTTRDAVERKKFLLVLEQSQAELQHANERLHELLLLKDEFVATVNHEIRTPLCVLREVMTQLAEGLLGDITKKQKEFMEIALRSLNRLEHLVSDLLDISKFEAGKMVLKKEQIDMAALAHDVASQFRLIAKDKGINLKEELPSSPVFAFADQDKITQVWMNLLTNAFKFTAEGSIEIALKDLGDKVEGSVSDTGRGLSEEDLTKVFEKFQQFGRQFGPGAKGTGLGLSICKGLVKAHGGNISTESKQGKGTRFTFSIPKS